MEKVGTDEDKKTAHGTCLRTQERGDNKKG